LGEATVSFSYPNELTEISTRGSIQNIYKYDAARGWLNSVQTPNGTINYSYDAAGNRTKVRITGKDGGNRETDYAYDELNRVNTVSRTGMGTLANYTYDAIGNVSQVTRANGVTSTYGYDDLHRLTSIQHKQGGTVLSQFQYALSADGKRNTLQEYLKYPAGQTVASVNRTVFYGYDAAGRLYAEQRQNTATLAAGGTQDKTSRTIWTYDKVGNRLTQAVSNYDGIGIDSPSILKSTFNTSYDYNSNDWLTKATSIRNDDSGESTFVTNFAYNANGSQTAVTSNVGKPEEKTTPYFYDFEQKLTRIGDTSDSVRNVYAYDADGNRIAESNTNASGTDVRNYLVDPNNSNSQIVEEYDGTGTLEEHYDWNDAELLREASLDTDTSTFVIHQPLTDAQNSTRQLLDGSGAISDLYAFDAWGNQQEAVGGAFNLYRYNGQRLDASGLYNLRARQYSSGIGRFLTHDPVMGYEGDPISLHRYMYASDDAVNFMDPSGLETLTGLTFGMSIHNSLQQINSDVQTGILQDVSDMFGGPDFSSMGIGLQLLQDWTGFDGQQALANLSRAALEEFFNLVLPQVGPPMPVTTVQAGMGMHGGPAVQGLNRLIYDILEDRGWHVTNIGGGIINPNTGSPFKEEGIPDPNWVPTGKRGRPKGMVFADITAEKNGRRLRIQTVDVDSLGRLTEREAENAAAIKRRKPEDFLILIPKLSKVAEDGVSLIKWGRLKRLIRE
jgi:RHS repeat-associated protein